MIAPLQENEFRKIRDLLVTVSGIALNDDHNYLVETRLKELGNEIGAKTFSELHVALVSQPNTLLSRAIDLMSTNETFWFRDDSCWNLLQNYLMPKYLQKLESYSLQKLRIWSAASSTGQEAYSLVILIDELCSLNPAWKGLDQRIEILATDISRSAISQAKRGEYDDFNMRRGLTEARKSKSFVQEGQKWKISEKIKERVHFKEFNLLDNFFSLGTFELILCRNVAIYFSPEFRFELYKKIHRALKSDSALIVGSMESIREYAPNFTIREKINAIYYEPK